MINTVNLAIGIGGSGAKSLEALVHLCGCGLGPGRLRLAIIDSDKANGNGRRTRDTIWAYRQARASFDREATGQSARAPDCGFLLTNLDEALTWSPLPSSTTNLRKLFNYESMSANVGAAVLAALPADTESFWLDLLNIISDAQQASEVRLFLIGSIFGGTGASGFPVVARMLRRFVKRKQLRQVRLSGAMLLPYFTFQPPDDSNALVSANPHLFVAKAQQSLIYYQGLMDEGTFDDLYIIGWPRMIRLKGDPKPGGNEQCNPPLLPELYTAFAAADVFLQPVVYAKDAEERSGRRSESERTRGIHYIAIGRSDRLSWSDLPPVGANSAGHSWAALANGLRFAYAYARVYHQYLKADKIRQVSKQAFWKNYFKDVKMNTELEQNTNNVIARYCEQMLRYFLTITDDGLTGEFNVRLFQKIGLVTGNMAADGLLELQGRADDSNLHRFHELVVGSHGLDLTNILHELSERPLSGREHGQGFGRFVSALHRYCQCDVIAD